MSSVPEIEAAIRKLSPKEIEELAVWIESMRQKSTNAKVEKWLEQAPGKASVVGATTEKIQAQTRGES